MSFHHKKTHHHSPHVSKRLREEIEEVLAEEVPSKRITFSSMALANYSRITSQAISNTPNCILLNKCPVIDASTNVRALQNADGRIGLQVKWINLHMRIQAIKRESQYFALGVTSGTPVASVYFPYPLTGAGSSASPDIVGMYKFVLVWMENEDTCAAFNTAYTSTSTAGAQYICFNLYGTASPETYSLPWYAGNGTMEPSPARNGTSIVHERMVHMGHNVNPFQRELYNFDIDHYMGDNPRKFVSTWNQDSTISTPTSGLLVLLWFRDQTDTAGLDPFWNGEATLKFRDQA